MGIFDRFRNKAAEADESFLAGDGDRSLVGHENEVTAVGFGFGGKLLLTGDANGKVIAWKAPTFERHFELAHDPPAPVYCFATDREGGVYFGRGADVKQWTTGEAFLDDFSQLQSFTLGEAHTEEVVPVLASSRELITGGYDGGLYFWDTESGVARGGSFDSPILSLGCTSAVLHDPNAGGLLAAGHEDGTVSLFDLESYEPVTRFDAHKRDVYAVSLQNIWLRGELLISTCSPADRAVRIWKADELIEEFAASSLTATFSPDGRFLAHGDGADVVIRDGYDWHVVRRLSGHQDLIRSLAFSPSETMEERWSGWLASGSNDHTARVWSFNDDGEVQ